MQNPVSVKHKCFAGYFHGCAGRFLSQRRKSDNNCMDWISRFHIYSFVLFYNYNFDFDSILQSGRI